MEGGPPCAGALAAAAGALLANPASPRPRLRRRRLALLSPAAVVVAAGVGPDEDGVVAVPVYGDTVGVVGQPAQLPFADLFGGIETLALVVEAGVDLTGLGVVDASGKLVDVISVRDLRGHYTPGTYYAMWEGDGCVTLGMDDVTASRRLAPGLIEFEVTPTTGLNNGIYLVLSCTKPGGDYVRNIRVLPRSALHTHAAFP